MSLGVCSTKCAQNLAMSEDCLLVRNVAFLVQFLVGASLSKKCLNISGLSLLSFKIDEFLQSSSWVLGLRPSWKGKPNAGNVIYFVQEYKNDHTQIPKNVCLNIFQNQLPKIFVIPPALLLHMLSRTGSADFGHSRHVRAHTLT